MPDDRALLQMPNSIDPYSPPQIAARIEASGVAKAEAPLLTTLILGLLAGVYFFGAMLYTVVMTGVSTQASGRAGGSAARRFRSASSS
jgi:formate/nitrite transporter FocA (FNT family)